MGLHQLRAHDFLDAVIGSLDQDVRPHGANQVGSPGTELEFAL